VKLFGKKKGEEKKNYVHHDQNGEELIEKDAVDVLEW
jgi:hypothetical protein